MTLYSLRRTVISILAGAGLIASALGIVGAYWDIAWHFDFGRDRFWSPPHLFIYGSVGVMTVALILAVALLRRFRNDPALAKRIWFGLGAALLTYSAAPLDELWHRLFGIDVQIASPPHLMLLAGGLLGTIAIISVLRLASGGRPAGLLRNFCIALFLGGFLTGTIILMAESEFLTLPIDHPVYGRAPWIYPAYALTAAVVVIAAAKILVPLRWSATLTVGGYAFWRLLPIAFLTTIDMRSVPIIPPFLLILVAVAVIIDAAFVFLRRAGGRRRT